MFGQLSGNETVNVSNFVLGYEKSLSAGAGASGISTYAGGLFGYGTLNTENCTFSNIQVGCEYSMYTNRMFIMSGMEGAEYANEAHANIIGSSVSEIEGLITINEKTGLEFAKCLKMSSPNYIEYPEIQNGNFKDYMVVSRNIYYKNSYIKEYKFNNGLDNNCKEMILCEELKKKAVSLGMIDVHQFPHKLEYEPTPDKWTYILFRLAFGSILNFYYVQDLCEFNKVSFEIEFCDVYKTLETAMNKISTYNEKYIKKLFNIIDDFERWKETIKENRFNILKIGDGLFEKYDFITKYFMIDKTTMQDYDSFHNTNIREYGSRTQTWNTIVSKYNKNLGLYIPRKEKECLSKIYHELGRKKI